MADVILALVWRICRDGYRYTEARYRVGQEGAADERVLVPRSCAFTEYRPLRDVPDLFRRFADISTPGAWEERVRHFADRYGELGIGSLARLPDGEFTRGESLASWAQESDRMRVALEVWEALQADDDAALRRWFPETATPFFRASHFVPDRLGPSAGTYQPITLLADGVAPVGLGRLVIGQLPDPTDRRPNWPAGPAQWALLHLRAWVNQQLARHAPSQLLYEPSAPVHKPLSLAIIPTNLLGGLWLQLARVVDGALRYARCAECGAWFRVKPKGNRATTRFCQAYCRVKANRRRHRVQKAAAR